MYKTIANPVTMEIVHMKADMVGTYLHFNPQCFETEFDFQENPAYYEYKNGAFSLRENWLELKASEETANDQYTSDPLSLEDLKDKMIADLNAKADEIYTSELAKYPKIERETFNDRKAEAVAYTLDPTTPTPLINATLRSGYSESERIEEVESVMAKVRYFAYLGGQVRDKRSEIKACTSTEELEALRENL